MKPEQKEKLTELLEEIKNAYEDEDALDEPTAFIDWLEYIEKVINEVLALD